MSFLSSLLSPFGGGGGGGQAGIGNKANSNSTSNTSTTSYADSSANAGGDGSIAAGEGATVNINNLSEVVATTALDTNAAVATKAIDANTAATAFTVNAIAGLSEVSARERDDTRRAADLAVNSTTGLANRLSDLTYAAVERSQAPEAASIKTILTPLLWGAGVIVVVLGAIFLFSRNRK